MAAPETLVKFIKGWNPVLWVGAGLSIPAGYPSAWRLAEMLWEKAIDPRPKDLEEYQLVDAFYEKYGSGVLGDALSDPKIISVSARPQQVHHCIARLAKYGFIKTVITTNYDRLIEDAFSAAGFHYQLQIIDDNQYIQPSDQVRLIKIHGDVSNWKKVIFTGDSYRSFSKKYKFLQEQLDVLLRQNPVLFVGCSMLDERILSWVEGLKPADRRDLKTWLALLTETEFNRLTTQTRPNGLTVFDLYQTTQFRADPFLPDYDAITEWFCDIAAQLTPPEGREVLILHIQADDAWQVKIGNSEHTLKDHPLTDDDFIENLKNLEQLIHVPLPCDSSGEIQGEGSAKTQLIEIRAAIDRLSIWIGQRLADVLGPAGKAALENIIHLPAPILFRIAATGPATDRVLALPWEMIHIDGCFPVKEAKIDLVREVVSPGNQELEDPDKPLRVLVHIAAPENAEGAGALNYEEEIYRLVLAMQQAADRFVIFSDLGTLDDLTQTIEASEPTIVHFTGHGAPGALLFENDEGDDISIQIDQVLREIRTISKSGRPVIPPVFYLASCHGATGAGTAESGGTADHPTGARQLTELVCVLGEAPSSAATLHRNGSAAVVAYFGPIGDQLSTQAETAFYSALVKGGTLTDGVRRARNAMQNVLNGSKGHYFYPLGWAQLTLFLRGQDRPMAKGVETAGHNVALEQQLNHPGRLKEKVGIPKPGRTGFIARRKEMATLRKSHRSGRRLFILQGLGGVGKTALALNLIPKLGITPERIILLDASNLGDQTGPETFLWTELQENLKRIEPTRYQQVLAAQKSMVTPAHLFQQIADQIQAPWLIYLDNAESLQEGPDDPNSDIGQWKSPELEELWNTIAQKAVKNSPLTFIATTRYRWQDLKPKDVNRVGALRSADLLRMMRWFPYLSHVPYGRRTKLVGWLNGHARALIYLEGLFDDYFTDQQPEEIDESEWADAIEKALPDTDQKLQNEDLLLANIWKKMSPESHHHLHLLSALRRPIPKEGVQVLGDRYSELDQYGLIIHYANQQLALHGTVSRFVMEQTSPPAKEDHQRIGAWYVNAHEEKPGPELAEEAVYHLVNAENGRAAAPLARQLAQFYRKTLQYFDCRRIIDEVIDLPMPAEGKIDLLLERGNLMNAIGQFEISKKNFQEALDISTAENLESFESQSLNGLANALGRQGKFDDAVQAYKKSMQIQINIHGSVTHPEYTESLHGMANALKSQGKFDDAVQTYKKSMQIQLNIHSSENHPDYAVSLADMANALRSQSKFNDAVQAYKKSMQILLNIHRSENHPDYGASLNGMANTLLYQGKFDDAVQAYKKSMQILLNIHRSENHPDYAVSLAGMAHTHTYQGKFDDAVQAFKKSMQILLNIHRSENHPDYAASLHGMANALTGQGKFDDAIQAYKKSMQIKLNVYGSENHPDFAASLHGMANAFTEQDKFDDAVQAYKKSMQILLNIHRSENHPDYAASLHGMANALQSQGKFDDAVQAYKKSMQIEVNIHGNENHPSLLPTIISMAVVSARQGNLKESISWLQKSLSISEESKQTYHFGNTLFILAQVICPTDPETAIKHAIRAKEILVPLIGSNNPLINKITRFIEQLSLKHSASAEQITLDDIVVGTLSGIEKISTEIFIRMALRVFLITGKLHALTAIATMTGQPGLELTDPTALTIPEQIMPEEAEKIKTVLPKVAGILPLIREEVETFLHKFTIEDKMFFPQKTESGGPIPEQFQQALLDETLYLLKAGSDTELAANLAFVLKGVGILLEDHQDEPEAVNIPLGLIKRLPDRRDEILGSLKPVCNEEQWERLLEG